MINDSDPYWQSLHEFKQALLESLRRLQLTKLDPTLSHEIVIPKATYAPWLDDPEFSRLYAQVASHTLVDKYRCYSLWDLVRGQRRVPGDALEVGVYKGGTAALIAAALACRDQAKVHLADTFSGVVKAGGDDTRYVGGEHADTNQTTVESFLRSLGLNNFEIHAGIFPDDTGAALSGRRFCFCHIDVDTYQSAKDIMRWIWPRLNLGGIVVFDDYGIWGCEGITRLVNELKSGGMQIIHHLNGQAIAIKVFDEE